MSKKKILISVVGGLGALVVGFVLYAYYEFTHNFRIPLTDQQMSNALIAFKGAMGEAIFGGQQLKAEHDVPNELTPELVGLLSAIDSQKDKRE